MNEIIEEIDLLFTEIGYIGIDEIPDSYSAQKALLILKHRIEQKLNIHGVMQAEASEGVEGAAVGNSAVGQNVRVGCLHKRWYEFDDCVVCLDCGLKKD